jgi:hypothetical protein
MGGTYGEYKLPVVPLISCDNCLPEFVLVGCDGCDVISKQGSPDLSSSMVNREVIVKQSGGSIYPVLAVKVSYLFEVHFMCLNRLRKSIKCNTQIFSNSRGRRSSSSTCRRLFARALRTSKARCANRYCNQGAQLLNLPIIVTEQYPKAWDTPR